MNAFKSAWSSLRRARAWPAVCLALMLAACGGGDESSSQPQQEPPTDLPASRAEAARFLTQATFGPTEAEVDRVLSLGYSRWINDQFQRGTASEHRTYWEAADATIKAADASRSAGQREVLDSFWREAVQGDAQLRQRVAFALSQIFVISLMDSNVANYPRGVAGYMDMLAEYSFGNFRDLLENVSRHPMMGIYLSHLRNQKEDTRIGRVPDQNYAREVMQLFSIGLNQLNLDGTPVLDGSGRPRETYTSDDIIGLSYVFTGFSWYSTGTEDACFWGWSQQCQHPDRTWRPMKGYAKFHSGLEKRFLGRTVAPQNSADPDASLRTAIDTLFAHPNVGPFISKQLIQRLVTSNPSPQYVARVATVFNGGGGAPRGDMKAVIRAILLDPEARNLSLAADPAYGKLREPVLRLSAFLRAFRATSDSGRFLIGSTDNPGNELGQTVMRSPSVFNFYRPGYVAPGTVLADEGLVAPEMQITHETTVAGYANYMLGAIRNGVGQRGVDWRAARNDVQPDFSRELALVERPAELVERMNQLLLYGQMAPELRQEIEGAVNAITIPPLNTRGSNQSQIDSARRNRLHAAVFLTVVSPEFIVQK